MDIMKVRRERVISKTWLANNKALSKNYNRGMRLLVHDYAGFFYVRIITYEAREESMVQVMPNSTGCRFDTFFDIRVSGTD